MIAIVGTNAIWSLVLQGDMMTKFILLSLFAMSIVSWSIALYKFVLFRFKLQQLRQVTYILQEVQDFKTLFEIMKQQAKTLPGYFLSRCCKFLKELLSIKSSGQQAYAQSEGIEFLQMQISQAIDDIVQEEESFISVLMVSASVSPLLGLLGTVWGLVHSFIDISQKQSADIVTVAPGIAEALITTIAGLFVAIPAVVLFFFLSSKVKEVEQNIVKLADKVVGIARNLVVESDALEIDQACQVQKEHV